jgi:dTMP kinase
MAERGMLIAFEGIDGSGLTTQATRVRESLERSPYLIDDIDEHPITFLTKEPTDGPVGGEIREVLSKRMDVDPETLALMFAADRRDHSEQEIEPMVNNGKIVIVDRYYLSSLAYQGVEVGDIEWLEQINSKAVTPDLTILLDVSASEAKARMDRDRLTTEIYETEAQLQEVRASYKSAAQRLSESGEDVRIIDGEQSKDAVETKIMRHIHNKMQSLIE